MNIHLGYALLRDRRVSVRSKLIALTVGLAFTGLVELLQLPFESVFALLAPVAGAAVLSNTWMNRRFAPRLETCVPSQRRPGMIWMSVVTGTLALAGPMKLSGALSSSADRRSERSHRQNPPARSNDLVVREFCSGLKNLNAFKFGSFIQTRDRLPGFVFSRITCGSQNHCDRTAPVPFDRTIIDVAVDCRFKQR